MHKKNNRTIILRFRVTSEENEIIHLKAKLANSKTVSSYLRRIALRGVIVNYENQKINKLVRDMSGIQTNINQIAMRVNSTNRVYDDDFKYLRKALKDIWQQLESVQSSLRSISQ